MKFWKGVFVLFVLLGSIVLCLLACNKAPQSSPTVPKNERHVFVLSDLKVENRKAHVTCKKIESDWKAEPEPLGLLVVYSVVPSFDLRVIGRYAQTAIAKDDPNTGKEIWYSTMVGSDEQTYVGAWWYVLMSAAELNDTQELSLLLPEYEKSGKILGNGEMSVALVQGKIGRGDFMLLSEPLRIAFQGEEPLPPSHNPSTGTE